MQLEYLIVFTVFVSVTAAGLALFTRPSDDMQRRLRTFRDMSNAEETVEIPPSFAERVLSPVGAMIVRALKIILPSTTLDRLQWRLMVAGDPVSLPGLLIIWVVCAFLLPGMFLVLLLASGAKFSSQQIGLTLVLLLIGGVMPHMWLRMITRKRQSSIMKTLPDAIDLLTTCVEAGLGVDAALGQVAEKIQGPIAGEVRHVLRDISMGSTRRDALKAFSDRIGLPDVKVFVNALIQAEQMGVSLGQVIRVQSDQMRIKRKQRAEQQAYKAPVKMVFPLVLFIFPSLFVVILGPAAVQVYTSFMK